MNKYIFFFFLLLATTQLPAQTKSEIKQAQQILATLGYEPGIADGVWGNKAMTALKQFQAAIKLPESGQLDSITVSLLQNRLQTIVAEIKSLVKNFPVSGVSISGSIGISPFQSCRMLIIDLSVAKKGKGKLPNHFDVFYQGLNFTVNRMICVPEKGFSINLDGSGGQGMLKMGEAGSKNKNSPYADEIINPMVAYIENVSPDANVFIFKPDAGELVFRMTKAGFMYISGAGTVTTPDGKIYSFPNKD